MTQFLLLLHKIVGFKLVAALLTTATVGVLVFQASNVLKVHALNVHIEVKATPPGITQIIDRSGGWVCLIIGWPQELRDLSQPIQELKDILF